MDFRQPTQPNGARPNAASATAAPERREDKASSRSAKSGGSPWLRVLSVILLVGIAALLVGIALAFTRFNSDNESKFVDPSKYQAVFLNNGQVYFGNIEELNNEYVRLTNVYYLTQSNGNSGSSNNSYSLVKLGCQQIHDPVDTMMVNRSQVTFWENLNSGGKVVSSIKQFQQQNPNGPNCSEVSSQTQASSSATQGGTTSTDTTSGNSSTTK